MPARKIFVTGATGFIGRHLVSRLVSENYCVGALVRNSSLQKNPALPEGITVFQGDIGNYEDVRNAITVFRPDAVIHLVTYYAINHRTDEIDVMVNTNVKGTINLLEAAKEAGSPELFINTSSCAIYEQKNRALSEDDCIKPQNLYALTKIHSEEACSFYANTYSLPCVTLRVFPPYGPGDHERRLIPYVIGCLHEGSHPNLTTGKQEWDFVFVEDIVDAYMAVLNSYPFEDMHAVFNIGTGQPASIRSVVEMIRDEIGSTVSLPWGSVPHRSNEVWYNSADIGKAKTGLHWTPATGLNEGIHKTVTWFRDYYNEKEKRNA